MKDHNEDSTVRNEIVRDKFSNSVTEEVFAIVNKRLRALDESGLLSRCKCGDPKCATEMAAATIKLLVHMAGTCIANINAATHGEFDGLELLVKDLARGAISGDPLAKQALAKAMADGQAFLKRTAETAKAAAGPSYRVMPN